MRDTYSYHFLLQYIQHTGNNFGLFWLDFYKCHLIITSSVTRSYSLYLFINNFFLFKNFRKKNTNFEYSPFLLLKMLWCWLFVRSGQRRISANAALYSAESILAPDPDSAEILGLHCDGWSRSTCTAVTASVVCGDWEYVYYNV